MRAAAGDLVAADDAGTNAKNPAVEASMQADVAAAIRFIFMRIPPALLFLIPARQEYRVAREMIYTNYVKWHIPITRARVQAIGTARKERRMASPPLPAPATM
jgi:hypothetical protein